MPEELLEYFGSMVNTDNPRHAQLRRIVSAAFSPRMIKSIEDRIEFVANEVIDRIATEGGCDFVVDVAARLPLEIICGMMGIGPADYGTVLHASNVITVSGNAIAGSGDPEYLPADADPLVALMEASQSLTTLMSELAEARRSDPTDDVTSALVHSNIDGESLSPAEVASFFILLVIAGNDTTRNAISSGLLSFAEHPDQRARWQADPAGIAPTGVDEIVRWGSPIIWMRRTVAEATVLGGEELVPGEKLLLFYNSANRDEDAFENPYPSTWGELPTRILASARPVRTSAWGPIWPARRSTCSSVSCSRACPTSPSPESPTGCAPPSSTGSSTWTASSRPRPQHADFGALRLTAAHSGALRLTPR